MKYFIYCRKSSEEEGKQLQSLETQKRILTEYAQINGFEVVDIIEERKSARKEHNRPKFTAMIKAIEDGKADGILVVDADRLTRNLVEGAKLIDLFDRGILKEIRTRSVIYASRESLNHLIDDISSSTQYSRKLSIKVIDGNATKLLKGEYPTFAPIGYINIPNNIIPDPMRGHFIKEIFNLYKTGQHSCKDLEAIMFEKGLRTRKGQKVRHSVIHRILNNPEYYGVIRRKGKIYPSKHEGLTDEATFDLCQEILSGKRLGKKNNQEFIYRPYLFCHNCGCKLTASIKKGRHIYYYCTNGKGNCQEHLKYLTRARVEELIKAKLDSFTLNEEMANLSFEVYAEGIKNDVDFENKSSLVLERQLTLAATKLKNLLDALISERVEKDEYDKTKLEISNEKTEIETRLKNLKNQDREFTLERVRNIKNVAIKLSKVFEEGDDEVKSDLLKGLLWNVTIEKQEVASIRFKKPFSYLQNLSKTADFETWRRGWDLNPRESCDSRG